MKPKTTITSFNKNSSFFFHLPKYTTFIDDNKSKKFLHPNKEELEAFKAEINKMDILIEKFPKNVDKNNSIKILENYSYALKNYFVSSIKKSNNYSDDISGIINEFRRKGTKISLKNIRKEYKKKVKKDISVMTISRIMRHRLNYHYLKKTVKNPLLLENNYKFMSAIFIKLIFRVIKLGLNIIYIDETGMQLSNNNFYEWRAKEEIIFGGAKTELKERLNLILSISNEKVINYLFTYENIDTDIMLNFLKDLIEKLGNKKYEYVLIFDNASYHVTKEIKSFLLKNKMKAFTNCPYYSNFNGIEYLFRNMKSYLYKNLFRNRKELQEAASQFLLSKDIKYILQKIYLKELKLYFNYAEEHSEDNYDIIYNSGAK